MVQRDYRIGCLHIFPRPGFSHRDTPCRSDLFSNIIENFEIVKFTRHHDNDCVDIAMIGRQTDASVGVHVIDERLVRLRVAWYLRRSALTH